MSKIIIDNEIKDSDVGFIKSAWFKVACRSESFKRVPQVIFFPAFNSISDDILARSKIYIARDSEDNAQLYGCMIADAFSLHFAYVKGIYRELGLFTEMYDLISNRPEFYSLETSYSKVLRKKGLKYNPFQMFRK